MRFVSRRHTATLCIDKPPSQRTGGLRKVARYAVASTLGLLAINAAVSASTSTIWTNSAGYGPPLLQQWDLNGNLLRTINAPHGMNGRGIAVLGNAIYYTSAMTNGVYAYDFSTNTDLGILPGTNGAGPITTDGSSLYVGGYWSNIVYKYSLAGTSQGQFGLGSCGGFCDGLEFANGRLLTNRGDNTGPYDIDSLSGAVLTPSFIADPNNLPTTGIAFDGTNYFVARVYTGQILVFNNAGVYQHTIALASRPEIEDISVETNVLKLCKVAGPGVPPNTQFTFSANGNAVSVPAGPQPGGYCVIAGNFPPNTPVTIQETGPAGFQVSNIEVAPLGNLTALPDLPNKKVQVATVSGVTEVTFTNQRLSKETGYLEICKQGNVKGDFSFTVNPGNVGPVVIPAGTCSPAFQVPSGQVVIQEAASSGVSMQNCATIPSSRQGPCNLAAQTSTVTVLPGGVGGQTIAIITNARRGVPIHKDEVAPTATRRIPPPGGACSHYDVTKAPPAECRRTR